MKTLILIVAIFLFLSFISNFLKLNMHELKISSSAFKNGESIPVEYTCDGKNINPPFEISGVDPKAKTLALIMEDPDAPAGNWVHWLVWNMSKNLEIIDTGIEPGGSYGVGTGGNKKYMGPCPPSGTHRYYFRLYSLDKELSLSGEAEEEDLERAMDGHILQRAELMGKYGRQV